MLRGDVIINSGYTNHGYADNYTLVGDFFRLCRFFSSTASIGYKYYER